MARGGRAPARSPREVRATGQRHRGTVQPFPHTSGEDRLTEAGAAESFCAAHADRLRYDHRRGRWLVWDGHHWGSDADAAVVRLVLDYVRQQQHHAIDLPDARERPNHLAHWTKFDSRSALQNLLALARALKPIADAGDSWDVHPWLLGVPNGVIDLRTGQLRTGRPDDRITLQTAVAYNARATCPRWEQFIAQIFAGNLELQRFIQRAIGYSLTGVTTEQALFLLYGSGANGKGTLVNTLKHVLGAYGWNMPFATIELRDRAAIPNDLAALVGRRFVIASETNDGTRLNEARVKALTGCDPITARFLHAEFFTFEPVAKFWLSVNHKPVVRDDSYGFWRRLRLIPFTERFDVNPRLADELLAEAPGILAWCVRGSLAWQQEGLQPPDAVADATRQYEHDSDPLASFLAEACERNQAAEVSATELFEHYQLWADQHQLGDRERLSMTAFGRKLGDRFANRHTRHGRVYLGIARRTM